jgi:hypothetical protein
VARRLLDSLRWFGRPALALLGSLDHVLALKSLRLRGRFGFADPARTGSLYGYLQASRFLQTRKYQLDLVPDFTRPGLYGRLWLAAHLHLGLLLGLLLRFAFRAGWRWLGSKPGIL